MHYVSTLFWQTTLHVSDRLTIIISLNTVFTATGICHTSYVACLLEKLGWNSTPTPDDGQ